MAATTQVPLLVRTCFSATRAVQLLPLPFDDPQNSKNNKLALGLAPGRVLGLALARALALAPALSLHYPWL